MEIAITVFTLNTTYNGTPTIAITPLIRVYWMEQVAVMSNGLAEWVLGYVVHGFTVNRYNPLPIMLLRRMNDTLLL